MIYSYLSVLINILMIKFQYYPSDITQCKPIGFVTLNRFLEAIKNPNPKNSEIFNKIKLAEENKDFETKAELKKQLYKFTPCVVVKNWRKYENIISFTGLMVLDFDHLDENYSVKLKQVLFEKCSFIVAVWLSPSRHGIKALVKIPICENVDDFKAYFRAIEKQLGGLKGFDRTTQNCVQDLFMSYDSELLQRDDATTWTEKYIEPIKEIVHIPIQPTDKTNVVVNIVVKKINEITTTGHYVLRAVSFALGGYVGAGYIAENDAIYLINRCIDCNAYLNKKASTYKKTAYTMIKNGIMQPIILEDKIHKKIDIVYSKIIIRNLEQYDTNSEIIKRIRKNRNGIKDFENRILSIKREINNIEGLIEINSFYSNPETNDTLFIN